MDKHICVTCLHCDFDCPKWNTKEGIVFDSIYSSANVIACDKYKGIKNKGQK